MTQTYPLPITANMVKKIDDGVPRPIPPLIDPGIATLVPTTPLMDPATWAAKAQNHPPKGPTGGISPTPNPPESDFILVTPVNKASNMPY